MDKEKPWNIYPRPLMKRDSFFSLNGEWDICISQTEPRSDSYTQKILVPFPPESKLSGIEREILPGERLYYRKKFALPKGFAKERVILHFGAVDQVCEVYLNGTRIGEHEGGYLPFSFDITDGLTDGENELRLTVTDELSPIYPYGKQKRKRGGMWYTPVSGIWQTVWIESTSKDAIRSIKITPSTESVTIEADTDAKEKKITLIYSGETFIFTDNKITVAPKEIHLWSPENPYIYDFIIETESDRIESYFALRSISIEKHNGIPRICLNGKPYLCSGLLDQGYFPDGIFLPATPEGYADDIKTAKALGFNMLRKHIKIEPEIFYNLCDRLGILVFQDAVNNSDYSFIRDTALPTLGMKSIPDRNLHKNKNSRAVFKEEMLGMARHLYSYPSVVYYTVFNEGWGQFCADEMYETLKSEDSTRIIDSTSGWFQRKKSDVVSHHVYFKKLKVKIDAERPTVISEFGGYSYRVSGHLFGDKNYGYKTFDTKENFENAVVSLYENEVKPLVDLGVSALVYTQLSDIEDETNGFLTYDRRVLKVDEKRMRKTINSLTEKTI